MAKHTPTTVKTNQLPKSIGKQNKVGVSNSGLNNAIAKGPRKI